MIDDDDINLLRIYFLGDLGKKVLSENPFDGIDKGGFSVP